MSTHRYVVVGVSGAGKSTLAARVATRLGIPHVELDALHHGPNWQVSPTFARDVDTVTASGSWVVDGNYSAVRDLVWRRADTIVWLDLPRWQSEWRVVRRTAGRLARRTTLWNGNRERLSDVLRPSHPISWSWRKHAEYRVHYADAFAHADFAETTTVRLRRRRDVEDWLDQLM